ncbi:hypothetical protein B4U37_04005 [Sutcliffiella horikoshii]|uniref:Uncharacterized protein n=1 Tax=Sutcliffiella horikoshii TaxID=79883 RepID=A0ABN4ZF19_9BACI|nr:hypothetical protein B4U37_04005 [Sutcliffiella horikoshii]
MPLSFQVTAIQGPPIPANLHAFHFHYRPFCNTGTGVDEDSSKDKNMAPDSMDNNKDKMALDEGRHKSNAHQPVFADMHDDFAQSVDWNT